MPFALKIDEVCHNFGDNQVLNHVNLKVGHGQFVALVGPSGCGKSTLLRAILGTHPPVGGNIYAHGTEITRPSCDVGIVYQHYSLYDFLTAQENVAFGPMLDQTNLWFRIFRFWDFFRMYRGWMEDARQLLNKLDLEKAINKFPADLSGGMKQRVAIAQAIIMKPKVLLLDEPFGALDESTREDLQVMLLQLYQENVRARDRGEMPPYTVVLVTHELNEAFYIADRVIGLSQYHGNGFPGATIVFDQPAPVFSPTAPRNFGIFFEQKELLRKVVFDEKYLPKGDEFVTFWNQYEKLHGIPADGVMPKSIGTVVDGPAITTIKE